MKRIRTIYRSVVVILCGLHVSYILFVAFSGDTRSKLRVENSAFVELPELCVCFPILEVINHTRLALNFPNIKLESDEKNVYAMLGSLKVGELYNSLKNHSNIIKKITPATHIHEFYRPKMSPNNCEKSYKFFETNFCIIIRCSSNWDEKMFYNRSVLIGGPASGKLLNIEFDASLIGFSERLTILLVPYDGILWSGKEAPIHHEIRSEPFILSLTYRVVRNTYEEKGFIFSPCFDYKKQGFRCRLAKEKKCRDDLAYKTIGAPYGNSPQAITYDVMSMKTGLYQHFLESPFHGLSEDDKGNLEGNSHHIHHRSPHSFKALFQKIRDVCDEVIPDCQETVLIPRVDKVRIRNGESPRIVLRAPDEFDYLNVYQPIFSVENILVYIQSCVGFWVGISPMSIVDWLDERIKRKNPKRGKTNRTR